jgi:HK97 family phage major capsid protein
MDKKLNELRQARAKAVDELEAVIGDKEKFEAKEAEIRKLDDEISRTQRAIELAALQARPSNQNAPGNPAAEDTRPIIINQFEDSFAGGRRVRKMPSFEHYVRKARAYLQENRELIRHAGISVPQEGAQFRTFGEQLIAVARYSMTQGVDRDPRLVRAPTGAGEIDPSAGGFLVQTDFATAVFMRAYELGEILSRVEKLSLSTSANSIKIPGVDETSRATGSRWGGVQSYWVGEGASVPSTKPKFRLIELDLKKLMSIMYVTDELLADQSVLTSIAGKAFSEEVMFMTEDGIFEGDGAGKPLGIKNAQCKVAVPKETGQATKTILY